MLDRYSEITSVLQTKQDLAAVIMTNFLKNRYKLDIIPRDELTAETWFRYYVYALSEEEGNAFLQNSADLGYPPARLILEKPHTKWTDEDIELLASAGHPFAMTLKGQAMRNSHDGHETDFFDIFLQVLSAGFDNSLNDLAICYFSGLGTEKDYSKAINYLENRAAANNVYALRTLGVLYGPDFYNKPIQSVYWLRMASRQYDGESQIHLAEYYNRGYGVKPDHLIAMKYLDVGATNLGLDVNLFFGKAYLNGLYWLDINPRTAVDYLRQSADKGNAEAQYMLAECLAMGKGCEESLIKVLEYAEKSKEQKFENSEKLVYRINRAIMLNNHDYFMSPFCNVVLRYQDESPWLMAKRSYDVTRLYTDHPEVFIPAHQESPAKLEATGSPFELDSPYFAINKELYDSFGIHWAMETHTNTVWTDEVAYPLWKDVHLDPEKNDWIIRVTQEKLKKNIEAMDHPGEGFYEVLRKAHSRDATADDLYILGQYYEYGIDYLSEDKNAATGVYLEAASKGSDAAIRSLYYLKAFEKRIHRIVADSKLTEEDNIFLKSASSLSGDELFELANQYAIGDGKPRNYAVATHLLIGAVMNNHAVAQFMLSNFMAKGYFKKEYTEKQILDSYQSSFDMGYKPAAEQIAIHALKDFNDIDKAIKYMHISGENGNNDNIARALYLEEIKKKVNGAVSDKHEYIRRLRGIPEQTPYVLFRIAKSYDTVDATEEEQNMAWDCYKQAAYSASYSDEYEEIARLQLPGTTSGPWGTDFPLTREPLMGLDAGSFGMASMIMRNLHHDSQDRFNNIKDLTSEACQRSYPQAFLLTNDFDKESKEEKDRFFGECYTQDEYNEIIRMSSFYGNEFDAAVYSYLSRSASATKSDVDKGNTVEYSKKDTGISGGFLSKLKGFFS